MIEIERTDFMSVPVTDLERSTRFYEETLGLRRVPGSGSWPEFETGQREPLSRSTPGTWAGSSPVRTRRPSPCASPTSHEARATLERAGVKFDGEIFDTGVCHMAFLHDPDGNALMLHRRYAPRES